jgi:phage terminase Nu1 subunit (DNA packaging protein)
MLDNQTTGEDKKLKSDELYQTKVIADLFGVTERRVLQLAQRKIIPKAAKGLYDLGPTVQAYIRYLHGLANGAISADVSELNHRLLQAQAEEREAKARMAELDLAVMQGRLHEAEHVKKIMADMIVACRSRLLAVPSKAAISLASMSDSVKIASYLRELVYESLEALSEYDPEKFNELNEKYVPPHSEEHADEAKKENR